MRSSQQLKTQIFRYKESSHTDFLFAFATGAWGRALSIQLVVPSIMRCSRDPQGAHVSPAGGMIRHQCVWQSWLSIQHIQFLIAHYNPPVLQCPLWNCKPYGSHTAFVTCPEPIASLSGSLHPELSGGNETMAGRVNCPGAMGLWQTMARSDGTMKDWTVLGRWDCERKQSRDDGTVKDSFGQGRWNWERLKCSGATKPWKPTGQGRCNCARLKWHNELWSVDEVQATNFLSLSLTIYRNAVSSCLQEWDTKPSVLPWNSLRRAVLGLQSTWPSHLL
jgi:hypothetical protein